MSYTKQQAEIARAVRERRKAVEQREHERARIIREREQARRTYDQ